MPTTLAREMSITYGTYTVGGSQANRLLDGVHIVEESFVRAIVEYTFVVRGTTEALFQDEIEAAESALRTPRNNLTITQGSETLKSYSHTSSTGFDADPVITKREDGATGRTRRYSVRIEFGLPADNTGTSGRRSSTVSVDYLPSRRRMVTISGVYTSIGGTTARAQYEGAIAAYVSSVTSSLGGTYKLAEEPITAANDTNKVIEFTRIHEEIIFTGVLGGDADIRKEVVRITRNKIAPGDSPEAIRLVTLNVTYEAWVDNTATTNLEGKWDSIRSAIMSHARSTVGAGALALVDENPEFDRTDNRITASMTILADISGGVFEYRQTREDNKMFGSVLVPVWTGDPHAKHKYQGPAIWQRTVTLDYKTTGAAPKPPDSLFAPPGGMQSIVVSEKTTQTPITIGLKGNEIQTLEVNIVKILEFYKKPVKGGAGGGTGGTAAAPAEAEAGALPAKEGAGVGGPNPAANPPVASGR